MTLPPFQPISNWLNEPENICDPLRSDVRASVVIIGAGFTGLYTAIGLRDAGVDVVLLEKDFAGAGASGRSAGFVDGIIGKDYSYLLKAYKIERARELCEFAKEAVFSLEAYIKDHKIDCDYVPNGNIMAAIHDSQIKKLKKLSSVGEALGLDFQYLDKNAMREREIPKAFLEGVLDPVGGIVDVGKLVQSLRSIAIAKGVKLYERTTVKRVKNSNPVIVECEHGTVTADKAVLATNAYTNSIGWKKRLMSPICCGVLETEPLTDAQLNKLGWNGKEGIYTVHERLESYRFTERGTVLVGGKYIKVPFGYKTTSTYTPKNFQNIEGFFRERLPELSDVKIGASWGGWLGMVMDFMPKIGVTGKHKNIHYALGYSAHGVPQTCLLGEMLTEQVQGKPHPYSKVLERKVIPIPPEPFKWLVTHAISGTLAIIDEFTTDRKVRKDKVG